MRWNHVALLICLAALLLAGCAGLALTALGVGASAGVSHTLNGINYRTFTLSLPKVRIASLAALKKMGIKVESISKMQGGELIKAKSSERDIEIQLEVISASTTRMRVVATSGSGLLYDSSTATEVIAQTERVLGNV